MTSVLRSLSDMLLLNINNSAVKFSALAVSLKTSRGRQCKRAEMTYSSADFSAAVIDYCAIHDEITEASQTIKLLRQTKSKRASEIMQYMEEHNIDAAELPEEKGYVRKYTAHRKMPAKKQDILQILADAVGDTRAEEVITRFEQDRDTVPTTTLKRQKPTEKLEGQGSKKKANKVQL